MPKYTVNHLAAIELTEDAAAELRRIGVSVEEGAFERHIDAGDGTGWRLAVSEPPYESLPGLSFAPFGGNGGEADSVWLTKEAVTKLRDALNEWLGDAEPKVFADCDGDRWYEEDDGTFVLYWGPGKTDRSTLHRDYRLPELRAAFGPLTEIVSNA